MKRQGFLPVVLVGQSVLLREGLAKILREANFRILASVLSADNFTATRASHASSLFLVVHTGDTFRSALGQIELIKTRHVNGRIAIIADHYRLEELTAAFHAGAKGYFVNAIDRDRFVKSLELVMMGETIFPPAFLASILDPDSCRAAEPTNDHAGEPILVSTDEAVAALLSPREKLILQFIIEGNSNKSIARKIDIAEATVKVHVKAILRKLRVQNRTQAAIWGINHGSQAGAGNGIAPPLGF